MYQAEELQRTPKSSKELQKLSVREIREQLFLSVREIREQKIDPRD
jgi:hypothetical protein